MDRKINVGLIGAGIHGSRYANHIINDLNDLFSLKGICCKTPSKGHQLAETFKTHFFPDYSELIAHPDIEAVISVTPPHLNKIIADSCLTHNKKLLLEKPLSTDLTEARHIVTSFKRANLGLTIGQTLRFNPVIKTLKDEFWRIGTPYVFSATFRLEPSTISWLDYPAVAGAGVIFHIAVHLFDALRYITGQEVKQVHASSFKVHTSNLEDLFTAKIEMDNGVVGIVESSRVTQARSARYEFAGSSGQLHGDQVHGFVEFVKGIAIEELYRSTPEPAILYLLKDWFLFLSGKKDNPVPGEDGLAAVKICDACRTSSLNKQWVPVF